MYCLNHYADALCLEVRRRADLLRIEEHPLEGGATLLDFGLAAQGGLEAGRRLAEICLSGLAMVDIVPSSSDVWQGIAVSVRTDHPVRACMASQYAGWEVRDEGFIAMGSGPMRAAAGKEPLYDEIGFREQADRVVGVLESSRRPTPGAVRNLAEACGVDLEGLTLAVAPTHTQAGTVQIVARSVETALHKLLTLSFDMKRIDSGWGRAPLPPVAAESLTAIGRTNDAILYGGEVVLWVRGDDASLEEFGPKVPSSASPEHGRPFAELFDAHGRDFYAIDPNLFSPAVVTFVNIDTGRTHRFGRFAPEVVSKSFLST